jgi:hypothetical protein
MWKRKGKDGERKKKSIREKEGKAAESTYLMGGLLAQYIEWF